MGFKIHSEDEPIQVNGIVTVIYGEPGIGKTSLAFTAKKPLLEDYDDGVKRCVNRKSYLRVDKWEDAIEFHNSPEFQTYGPTSLIVDTAGTLLDNYIAQYAIRQDIKNGRNGGELSLNGYGALKSIFRQFVAAMKAKGVDLIFICHTETMKEGDNVKFIPKMTGGSYDILVAEADMLGYMESRNNKRTLNFNPTDRNIGKNTAEFPVLEVPHYTDNRYATFMADLIARTKTKMMELSESQKDALKLLDGFRSKIEVSKSMNDIDKLLPEIDKLKDAFKVQLYSLADTKYKGYLDELVQVVSRPEEADEMLKKAPAYQLRYQGALKKALWDHCQQIGLAFDKDAGKFKVAAPDTASNVTVAAPVTVTEPAKTTRRMNSKPKDSVAA